MANRNTGGNPDQVHCACVSVDTIQFGPGSQGFLQMHHKAHRQGLPRRLGQPTDMGWLLCTNYQAQQHPGEGGRRAEWVGQPEQGGPLGRTSLVEWGGARIWPLGWILTLSLLGPNPSCLDLCGGADLSSPIRSTTAASPSPLPDAGQAGWPPYSSTGVRVAFCVCVWEEAEDLTVTFPT